VRAPPEQKRFGKPTPQEGGLLTPQKKNKKTGGKGLLQRAAGELTLTAEKTDELTI